jgi:hypothetical protein
VALWNFEGRCQTRWKTIMAKITAYIPEPKQEYDVENQRQILQSVDTIKNELNFSFQKDLKEEQDTYNYFLS